MGLAERITAKEFAAVMRRLKASPEETYAVGVAGCAESLALTLLLKEYAGQDKVFAIYVEHGLKDGRFERDAGRFVQKSLKEIGQWFKC
jgi:tRNA(Ile)-lysidine synthase TilS/MesJ